MYTYTPLSLSLFTQLRDGRRGLALETGRKEPAYQRITCKKGHQGRDGKSRCDRGLVAFWLLTQSMLTSTPTSTSAHPTAHTSTAAVCLALAGADAAMRTVISPSVAVATPTRGKSRRRWRAGA